MSGLSYEQVRFFRTAGYFRLLDVLGTEETTTLRRSVIEAKVVEEARRRARNDNTPVNKLYGLYSANFSVIRPIITNSTLIAALQSLLGPDVIFVTNRHNHAAVNDSMGTKYEARLHRDILQPTRGLLTVVVYLEDSSIANGCTHILPASHLPFVGVAQPNGRGTWMEEYHDYHALADQALPVPMPEGSMLLFDGLAFHSVGQNCSTRTRISITLAFRAVDELDRHPDPERHILVVGHYLYRGNDK